eukprot:m.17158 g.17158  ORF g.17158 m.17158 type:complete len:2041 (+) comp27345_c0_seq1:160-6282(+)
MSKVIVAVRVRPMNHREVELGSNCVVDMTPRQTVLKSDRKGRKTFAYDYCFWSMDDSNPKHTNQDAVFEALGRDVLENAFSGYNACVFAYGQTGSGKSYTMMGGGPGQKGIIPRLCDSLFEQISDNKDSRLTFKVEVSYMEIYNEKVRDLLDPRRQKHALKVREHQILGPYVDGLSKLAVKSFADIESLMVEGNKSRTVASTNMNSESSRSHAVFTVVMTQTMFDPETQAGHEKVSKISLVDLAGSERAGKSGAEGDRLREGSNINKSLTTLGLVISHLADQSSGKSKRSGFVPYRDSVLTWLLKDNLGGNSKTVMVATISPAEDNYEETLSTLRYADRAKRIVNHAIVNEDRNAKVIRELREELDRLRGLLTGGEMKGGGSEVDQKEIDELKDKLAISERLMTSISMTWEEKLAETERIHQKRQEALEEMGISIEASGIGVESGKFYLVNLNADPSLNELLVYYLRPYMRVGRQDAVPPPDIKLRGLGIHQQHCVLETEDRDLYLIPEENAQTFINGCPITERTLLYQGDRILWGNNHFFRVSCDRKRESVGGEENVPMDYESAKKEVAMNEMSRTNVDDMVKSLEEKHIADKQDALDEQKTMYEKKLEELRGQMTAQQTATSRQQLRDSVSPPTTPGSVQGSRQDMLSDDDEELYNEEDKRRLKETIFSAMEMVREANNLSTEMEKDVKYKVSLQIREEFLSPRHRGAPKRKNPNEVIIAVNYAKNRYRNTTWSVDKLEDKLVDMREMYERLQEGALKDELDMTDPFYEQESHQLIGVANLFLESLHHDVELEYSPPIIDPKGEICGRLDVQMRRLHYDDEIDGFDVVVVGNTPQANDAEKTWQIQVSVVKASGLPPELCKYIFCQYDFFDHQQVIVSPQRDQAGHAIVQKGKVIFDNDHIFPVLVSEELVDYIAYGCLRFKVYGNRSAGFSDQSNDVQPRVLKNRSLSERWSEVLKRFEMIVEVMELNETGEYAPVQLVERPDNRTGGIFLLKQGQSRRIQIAINAIKGSGSGPIAVESVEKISIGAVVHQHKNAISLDSFTDVGLESLRTKWSSGLMKRRAFLDEQIHRIVDKSDRSKEDMEKESELIDEWTLLQWERQAVTSPMSGTGVPGSPSVRNKHLGPSMETKVTVVFLDLNEEVMSLGESAVIADDYTLDGEDDASMIELPIVKKSEKQILAVASWDSSQHDDVHLNKATNDRDRVYLVLKVIVKLSHPWPVHLVLRKRICVKIYKKSGLGIASALKQKFGRSDKRFRCGAVYEIAAGIPKQAGMDRPASPDPEQMLAAEAEEENVLERYSHGVSSVTSILSLDRLRQEVAVKERLNDLGRPLKKLPPPLLRPLPATLSRADSDDILMTAEELEENAVSSTAKRVRAPSPGSIASAISEMKKGRRPFATKNHNESPDELVANPQATSTPVNDSSEHKPVRRLISLALEGESEGTETVERPPLDHVMEEEKEKGTMADIPAVVVCAPDEKQKKEESAEAPTEENEAPTEEKDQQEQPSETGKEGEKMAIGQGVGASTSNEEKDEPEEVVLDNRKGDQPRDGLEQEATTEVTEAGATVEEARVEIKEREMQEDSEIRESGSEQVKKEEEHSVVNVEEETEVEEVPRGNDAEKVDEAATAEDQVQQAETESIEDGQEAEKSGEATEEGGEKTTEVEEMTGAAEEVENVETSGETLEELSEEISEITEAGKTADESGIYLTVEPNEEKKEEMPLAETEEGNRAKEDEDEERNTPEFGGTAEETQKEKVTAEDKEESVSASKTEETKEETKDANPEDGKEANPMKDNLEETPRISTNTLTLDEKPSEEDQRKAIEETGKSERTETPPKTEKSPKAGDKRKKPESISKQSQRNGKSEKKSATCESLQRPDDVEKMPSNDMSVRKAEENADAESTASSTEILEGEVEKPKVTVKVGEVVMVEMARGYKMGTVKYVGETQFQPGEWIGVALDGSNGKHNGTVKDVVYFKCKPKHGVFVKVEKIIKSPDLSTPKPVGSVAKSVRHSPTPPKRTSLSGSSGSRRISGGAKPRLGSSAVKK